jgi:hypothetical protein
MGLHETKKHLHSKGNGHQAEKTAYRMVENICQLFILQRINNQTIHRAQKTNFTKNQTN